MKDKLLVVADLGLLKAYRLSRTLEQTPQLRLMEEVRFEQAHLRVLNMESDSAGRRGGGRFLRGATPLADAHHLELEIKRRLSRQIARALTRFLELDDWGACWFAAPKEIRHGIIDHLSPLQRLRIRKNLPLDLTKFAEKELLEEFIAA